MPIQRWTLLAMLTLMGSVLVVNSQGFAQSCNGQVVCTIQLTFGPNHGSRPATNGKEIVYESNGPVIVSIIRGVLDEGLRPDISATGEVVYFKEVIDADGQQCPQIF
jgi:hypothetical protein